MKRQIITSTFLTVFLSVASAQDFKCFNDGSEADRKDSVAAFMKKDYKVFEQKFNALCKKYSATISCKTETLSMSKASERMSQISRQSICAEVMKVDSGKKTTLYSLDDKKAPSRK